MNRHRLLIAGVLCVALATACGDDDGGSASPPELDGREFVSTEVDGYTLVPGTEIRISFADGALSANAGCNTMNGGYSFDGSTMQVDVLAMTQMACDEELTAQDDFVGELVTSGPTVALDDDTLTITSGDTVLTMVDREVAEPDLPLEGTTWQLESIIQNEAIRSVPDDVGATLVIGDDGSATVETGCNGGTTTVEVGDGTMTFDPMAVTLMLCEGDAGDVEQAVLATLAGEVTYEIDSDVLSIRTADGSGLDYRGQ
jgi:heat shock protein HslJ